MFPLFTARFFNQGEDAQASPRTSTPKRGAAAQSNVAEGRAPGAACRIASLKALDLQTLPRDDGPPTELRTRKEKMDFFDRQCSHVGDRLYVSGETVAKRKDIMHGSSITHIVNCVGFLYPAYFQDEFTYQTLYLQGARRAGLLHRCPAPPARLVFASRTEPPRSPRSNRRPAPPAAAEKCRLSRGGHPLHPVRRV